MLPALSGLFQGGHFTLALMRATAFAFVFFCLGLLGLVLVRRVARPQSPVFVAKRVFAALSLGCGLPVAAFALWRTRGVSVALAGALGMVTLVASAYRSRREDIVPPATSWPHVLLALGVALPTLGSFVGFHVFATSDFPLKLNQAANDGAYYASIAEALAATGIETTAGIEAELDPARFQPEPYHYGELWLGALLARVQGERAFASVLFDAALILGITLLCGFLAVLERERALSFRSVCFSVLFLFFAPVVPAILLALPVFAEVAVLVHDTALVGDYLPARQMPGLVAGVGALLLARYGRVSAALFVCSIAAICNSSLLALPLGGIAAVVFFRRELEKNTAATVAPALVLLASAAIFYASFSGALPANVWSDFLARELVQQKINIVGKSILQASLTWFPTLLVLAWFRRVRELAVIASVGGFGLLGWVLTASSVDAYQLFVNPTGVVLNLATWYTIVTTSGRSRMALEAWVVVAALVRWQAAATLPQNSQYSKEFLGSVEREVRGYGGFVLPETEERALSGHALFVRSNVVPYLIATNGPRGAVALFDVLPRARKQFRSTYRVENYLFRQFAVRMGCVEEPPCFAVTQAAFVDHYGLSFVVLVRGATPPAWLVSRETRRIVDSVSGDVIVMLAPPMTESPVPRRPSVTGLR